MPHSRQIATETLEQLRARIPALQALTADEQQLVREIIHRGIARQVVRDIWQVWNHAGSEPREALLEMVEASVLQTDCDGKHVVANTRTPHWREWYPGLSNADMTLGQVMDSLPGFSADQIPPLVRLFENPQSPTALTGACTLEQHDAIHVLLGRGLVDQDEAFTIGFTAGTSKEFLTEPEKDAYRIALQAYQEPYRIKGQDLLAFDLGVKAGAISPCTRIHEVDVAPLRGQKLGPLRAELGIDVKLLRDFYQLEQRIIPGTPASLRLPV